MNPSAIQQLMFSLQDGICTFPQAHVTVFMQFNNSETVKTHHVMVSLQFQ